MHPNKWPFHWAVFTTVLIVGSGWLFSSYTCAIVGIKDINSPAFWAISTVTPILLSVIAIQIVMHLKSINWREALEFIGFKKPNLRQVLVGALSLIPAWIGIGLSLWLETRKGAHLILATHWLAMLFMLTSTAGIYEEVIFRGFLFRMLRSGRTFWEAAALSGTIWSLGHFLNFSWGLNQETYVGVGIQVITAFILGFCSAYVFEAGGNNIWGWMLAHLGLDLPSLIKATENEDASKIWNFGQKLDAASIYAYVGMVLTVLSTFWLVKRFLPEGADRIERNVEG